MQQEIVQTTEGEKIKIIHYNDSKKTIALLLGIITILFISNVWLLNERIKFAMKEKYCLDTLQLYYDHYQRSKQ